MWTTFGVGGPARYFLNAMSEQEILEGLDFAKSQSLPVFVLGGGSNLLVADRGFEGLVLRVGIKGRAWDGFPASRRCRRRLGRGCRGIAWSGASAVSSA